MADEQQGILSKYLPDLLGLLGAGTGALASKAAIIGPKAFNWNKANAAKATELEKINRFSKDRRPTPEEIYDQTKLYQGHTGGLRQYITDEGLVSKKLPNNVPREGIPFQDVVEWPEVFNNYPHIADIPVRFNQPRTSYNWGKNINLMGGC